MERKPHPPVKLVRCTSYLPRVAALFVSCDRCDYAMRPPARGRAPAQDISRASPAARQTDTSHNSIQQSEQRLCFGIELPDADVLPSNPSRWRDSSVESRAGWAFICYTRHSHPFVLKYRTDSICAPISAKSRFVFCPFFLFFSLSLSCLRCGPRRGGALLPKTQAAPSLRRGRQSLAITQFSKASSACISGLAFGGRAPIHS